MAEKNTIPYLKALPSLGHKFAFRQKLARKLPKQHDWAEFGVHEGKSARIWLQHMPIHLALYLFDSWEGLPEDWGDRSPKGTFATKIPNLKDRRAVYVPGWFEDSLPPWCERRGPAPLSFVHIDCDLYSSTTTVLDAISPMIDRETVVLFDEYYHDQRQREHEYQAFMDYIQRTGREFEYIARSDTLAQVAVRLLS